MAVLAFSNVIIILIFSFRLQLFLKEYSLYKNGNCLDDNRQCNSIVWNRIILFGGCDCSISKVTTGSINVYVSLTLTLNLKWYVVIIYLTV